MTLCILLTWHRPSIRGSRGDTVFALDALIIGVETREPVLHVFHPLAPFIRALSICIIARRRRCNRVKARRITLRRTQHVKINATAKHARIFLPLRLISENLISGERFVWREFQEKKERKKKKREKERKNAHSVANGKLSLERIAGINSRVGERKQRGSVYVLVKYEKDNTDFVSKLKGGLTCFPSR